MKFNETIELFTRNRKWVVFWLLFFYPFGVYLMWKGEHFNPNLRLMISLFWLILYFIMPAQELTQIDSSDCSTTFYQDGCSYYRDSNCQVIAKSCNP